jgi:dehydrogenase/reductase SDR family member 12
VRFLDQVLDASVVLSFDRTGFRRHARAFLPSDLRIDLTGKVALVTGANSGLGLATTRRLAALGAQVWMLCRDEHRGAKALVEVRAEFPAADVRLARLDVSLLSDVERFAAGFEGPVDLLVNNAGVLTDGLQHTSEGHELTFATNVLGPFALTRALQRRLRERSGRAITVSSGGMYTQSLDVQVLRGTVVPFDGLTAYAQTKRAEVVLNELWAAREPKVMFAAMHPGWADTPSVRQGLPRFHRWLRPILRSPDEGADTIVWLAACPRIAGMSGLFWFDRTIAPTQLYRRLADPPEQREALWTLLEQLVGKAPIAFAEPVAP